MGTIVEGREGHASFCKVIIKEACIFGYLKGHLFGLFLHIHNKHFYPPHSPAHLVLWVVIKDGLVDMLEHVLTWKSFIMLA